MGQLKFCRLCTKLEKDTSLRKLFEKSQKKWLKAIQQITGLLLKNSKSMPQHICNKCQDDLEKAQEFRERCLFAQEYFNTEDFVQKFKLASNKNVRTSPDTIQGIEIKDEFLPLAESAQAGICFEVVKEESKQKFQLEPHFDADNFSDDFNADEIVVNEIETNNIAGNKLPCKEEAQTENELNKSKPKPTINKVKQKDRRKKHSDDEKNQTFICDQCGNNFTCKHHFLIHLRRHTGDKTFQCEICPNKFFTYSELNRHMRRHTGERPFGCKHCGRKFTDYSTRIKHERTHTNERPFECSQCSKAFTTSYILKNHMLIHTGERSFRCELCNRAFQRQTHLNVHFKSILHKQQVDKQQQGTSGITDEQISC